jgi:ribonuclease P protein component
LLTRRGMDQLDNAELSSILRQQWQKLERQVSTLNSQSRQDS